MSFEQQSQSDVLARLKTDLATTKNTQSAIEGTFNGDMLSANSIEFAAAYNEMNLLIQAAFADTSWGDYLTMRASEMGVTRKAAVSATATVTVTGTANSQIISGSLFATAEGLQFRTLADATIPAAGTIDVAVQCTTTGTAGNVDANTITSIPYSIPGVTGVTNASAATEGYDEETDSSLLARYLLQVRTPSTSGNKYHYEEWALAVAGVGQAKILPLWNGNGTVKVLILNSNNQVASAALIATTAAYIETLRPIGATVTVDTPTALAINISATITGTDVTTAFTTALTSYFKTYGFSLSAVSIAKIGALLLSQTGVTDYSGLTINGGSVNIPVTDTELPVVGTVTLNVA
ncbi:hypothetical protein AB840_09975 [Megasphaera cerevisiae DSM 20462]|uniref:Uncharacterized protein n=1 Tax=Megasphaera cerevisiae DSM 20462 TaxID=1122219 RepID=A0A0J6ZMF2_9FIRM|nr:baseplate J/gp47 family protein [Megasphaera cerevisiae]KMO86061.1 hypothetical protein AB840_09975 [Megasphaera cerevisiae DSM 20462]SKA01658.1 Uncharacterized phage protein gp47/JayE [Megasphaera cerevisiae DSM 20462]